MAYKGWREVKVLEHIKTGMLYKPQDLEGLIMETGEIAEDVDEETNIIPFKPVIVGGKDADGAPPNGPWLLELPRGSTFLCYDKMDKESFTLLCFHVIVSDVDYVVLLNNTNDHNIYTYVNPVNFSNRFTRHKVLRKGSLGNEYFE